MKNKDEIRNELQELSPLLLEVRDSWNEPMKVPNGYFDALRSGLFSAIDAGFADKLGHKAFTVPEGYFENLTASVMDRIDEEEGRAGRVIDLHSARRRTPAPVLRWLSMAASVMFLLAAGLIAAKLITSGNTPEGERIALTKDEAMMYVQANLSEFESEDLIALVDIKEGSLGYNWQGDEMKEDLKEYIEDNLEEFDEYLLTGEI